MTILLLLVPLGLLLLLISGIAFVWAVKRGQFENLDGEGVRILLDDDRPLEPPKCEPDREAPSR